MPIGRARGSRRRAGASRIILPPMNASRMNASQWSKRGDDPFEAQAGQPADDAASASGTNRRAKPGAGPGAVDPARGAAQPLAMATATASMERPRAMNSMVARSIGISAAALREETPRKGTVGTAHHDAAGMTDQVQLVVEILEHEVVVHLGLHLPVLDQLDGAVQVAVGEIAGSCCRRKPTSSPAGARGLLLQPQHRRPVLGGAALDEPGLGHAPRVGSCT